MAGLSGRVPRQRTEKRGSMKPQHMLTFPQPPAPPPNRGALLTPEQVAARIGKVTPKWVRDTVPNKVTLSHSVVRWYEFDVDRWIASCRQDGAA